jgi:hypothetical protein
VEPEEELIPAPGRIPWRPVPPWLAAAGVFFVLFFGVGVYSERLYETIDLIGLSKTPASVFQHNVLMVLMYGALVLFIPALGALATLWAAFASPRWSDRYLWSAAMIFSAMEVAVVARQLFSRPGPSGTVEHLYPNPLIVTGLIAYGSWLLIAVRGALPIPVGRAMASVCAVALVFVVAFPLVTRGVRWIDIIGSILFAAACSCAGVFVAQLCGVDLFKRNSVSAI